MMLEIMVSRILQVQDSDEVNENFEDHQNFLSLPDEQQHELSVITCECEEGGGGQCLTYSHYYPKMHLFTCISKRVSGRG